MKPDWDKLGEHFNSNKGRAQIADVDCTVDSGKSLCEKYGVQGYPTIKYFSKETSEQGESYDGEREYNKLKKFIKQMSRPPCEVKSLSNCNQKEKEFINESKEWDETKMMEEKKAYSAMIDAAKAKHKELTDLFEKQKDEAMATMKKQEEAKKEMEKITKDIKFKINLLVQKAEMNDGQADTKVEL